MRIYRFSLRIPIPLHSEAMKKLRLLQEVQPGLSLNDLICTAIKEYVEKPSS